ncbi:hypothetical protein CEE34_00060 [Candidatus Aerophobetes bacterium Ae_b3a]|nr:MAG: hypothetical protein CEE34_00060 [Candidatus Aerophobetes bacterium Ae_b3a]
MKIKGFSITRYGPLSKMEQISLGNFNLFFGRNEEGKTLTIDALVKMLLRKNIRDFIHINRVEENPEGYVIIENEEKEEVKLPEKGDLTKLADLTSSECRNIFIIRNSDLSIAAESEFYTNVTDRLTGLKTRQILSIKNKLQELGKLTRADSTASLSNKKEFGKIKSRLDRAAGLIEKTSTLEDEVKEEGFDRLEEESIRVKEEKDKIREKIEEFEEAGKREKYEKGKEALKALKRAFRKSKDLEVYNQEDSQLWRDNERDIKANEKEKEQLLVELDKKEKKFQKTSENLKQREQQFHIFKERKKELDNEVKPEIKNYQTKKGELVLKETKNKFLTFLMTVSVILLGVSLLGIIIRPGLLFYLLAILFSISFVVSSIFKLQLKKEKGSLAQLFERIKLNLSRFALRTNDIEGVLFHIQKFEDQYGKKAGELEEVRGEKKLLQSEMEKLKQERITEIEDRIKSAYRKIEDVKIKTREESLPKYSQKLRLKLKCEKLVREQESFLKALLGEKGESLEENISHWDEELKELEEYKDRARHMKYNEKSIAGLKEKGKLLEEESRKIESTMEKFQKELAEIERRVNEILGGELEEDYLYCKTSVDLEAIENKLQESIDENETNKDNVLEVMKIFEKIEKEEKEKVSQLFGEESSVSQHFKEITDGLYQKVVFQQERGKIKVERKDGLILDAEKLSGGAYDQLYLSIRLALGEKLLKKKKGFFIMDDPFIKASPDRLKRQMKMLKRISSSGWQIIYFTAKGEVKEALKEDIDSRMVNYVEVKSSLKL